MLVICFVTIDVLKKKGNFPQFLLLSATTFVKKKVFVKRKVSLYIYQVVNRCYFSRYLNIHNLSMASPLFKYTGFCFLEERNFLH